MKKRHSFTLAVLAAALLPGCGADAPKSVPGLYALPLGQAMARLEAADIDTFRDEYQCGILIHFTRESSGNSVTWRASSSGRPVARFTVTLAPEGQGTRATIEVPPGEKHGEIYDGHQEYFRPALNQPLRPGVQELIDAAIAQRPYDIWKVAEPRLQDGVCTSHRQALENGYSNLKVDDTTNDDLHNLGSSNRGDEEERRRQREEADRNYGKPMMQPGKEEY